MVAAERLRAAARIRVQAVMASKAVVFGNHGPNIRNAVLHETSVRTTLIA